jgi:inosine-uridine nucleoside N-ribohydrolase
MAMSRRAFLGTTPALGALVARASAAEVRRPTAADTFGLLGRGRKIPVIFDTDIGGDIDDTWALCMMLKCPELDVKLVAADAGNTTYRARILAKMLEVHERTDIPVAVGIPRGDAPGNQSEWTEGYALDAYPGRVHEDGVGAIIDTIHASPDPVTVICIGAVPNVAAALERDPTIVDNARFVGMHGSVRRGYGDGSAPAAEANVRSDPQALRAVFSAPWDCTVTPLDTCDRVRLLGEKYQRVYGCDKPGVRALIENYRVWKPGWANGPSPFATRSTTLFDTVAVYLSFSQDLLAMEDLPLRVTDDGHTVVDETQRPIHCAMDWKDLGAFEDLLVERLVS